MINYAINGRLIMQQKSLSILYVLYKLIGPMQQLSYFVLTFLIIILSSNGQIVPVYGNSPLFQSKQVQTSIPTPQALLNFNFLITPTLGLSPQTHRKPFISITGIQTFQTQNDNSLLLLSQILFTSTSLTIKLVFKFISPTKIVSWSFNSPIKFYYFLIDSTFPDTYISAQLELGSNMNFPSQMTKTQRVKLVDWIGSNAIVLSATGTKFIYAITHADIKLTSSTNKFSVNLQFLRKTNNQFEVNIKSFYSQKINLLRVSVFIYNIANFDSYLIKITHNFYVSPVLPIGATFQYQAYSSWNVYPGMHLILGLGGFQFNDQPKLGFQFSVDTSVANTVLTLGVKNIYNTAVIIPKLQVTLFSISQLQCPNSEPYINPAKTQCFTVCPPGTTPKTTFIPMTTLKQCIACTPGTFGCCAAGTYWDNTVCTTCQNSCQTCNSANTCLTCKAGYFLNSTNNCQACSTGCASCTLTGCTECSSDFNLILGICVCKIGTYLNSGASTCSSCASSINHCVECSSATTCTKCGPVSYLSSGLCLDCSSNCLSCDSTGCLQCDSGFSIFNVETSTPSLVCKTCGSVYDPQCVTCDQTQCLTCSPSYFYRTSKSSCQLLSSVVCGDSDWVYEIEACDDANPNDNDGCSADCKVETDYVCLTADQLPSGASFCKYNRNFYLEFFYLEKEVSSNTVHVFFKLQPSTFNFWTQQTVEMLLNPVTIVDSDTGNIQTVPVNSLNLVFTRNQNINQIELTIDYDGSNMEGSFLQFNIQPSSTGVASITHLTTQNNLHLKVDSEKSGVYLFSYSQDVYSFQSLVSTLSLVVGLMVLMMLVLGCCVLAGKLIILECLAVVQISYFSLMQFEKIPPTFIGLKNLMFSNGYNEANMFGQVNQGVQDVYKLMGIQRSVISNDNISLIVFVILPILIGLIGYLISKHRTVQQQKLLMPNEKLQLKIQPPKINPKLLQVSYEFSLKIIDPTNDFFSHMQKANYDDQMVQSQNHQNLKNDSKSIKEPKQTDTIQQTKNLNNNDQATNLQESKELQMNKQEENQQKLTLAKIISSRILYQMSFYGIIVTSYLSWVSIFHSFSHAGISDFIFLGTFTTLTVLYGILYFRSDSKSVQLNKFLKQEQATNKIFPQKNFILTQFGELSQVYNQITVSKMIKPLPIIHKFYVIFILERLVTSILINMLPQFIQFTSIFLMLIYAIILLVMVIIYRKSLTVNQVDTIQKDYQDNDQNNETIRTDLLKKQNPTKTEQQTLPSLNPKTSIFSYLHQNYILRQSINIMTIIIIQILYTYTNIVLNSQENFSAFTNNFLIIKIIPISIIGLLSINMLFNQFLWIWEIKSQNLYEKCRIIFYSIFKQKFQVKLEKMRVHMDQLSQAQRQQAEVVKMMNNFMEKSSYFQPKENPFLGIEQKQKQLANQAFLDLLKIQDKKLQIPFQVKKRKNWLIERYWEYI